MLRSKNAVNRRGFVLPFVAAVFVLLIAGIVKPLPVAAAESVAGNFAAEFAQRMETTPLQANTMVNHALQSGTVNFSMEMREEWTDYRSQQPVSSYTGLDISIASDAQAGAYIIRGDINANGEEVDFVAYINRERIALGSQLFGSDVYGLHYDRFPGDIYALGSWLGLSLNELGVLADAMNEISAFMNSGVLDMGDTMQYLRPLANLSAYVTRTDTETEMVVDGAAVSAKKIEYVVASADIARFLRDWADMLAHDESALAYDMREIITQIAQYVTFDIAAAFYIDSQNRFFLAEIEAGIDVDGQWITFDAKLDLGAGATDTWTFGFIATGDGGRDTAVFDFVWECNERDGVYENVFNISIAGDNYLDKVSIMIDWDANTGLFVVSVFEEGRTWANGPREIMRGYFTTDGETSRLSIDLVQSDRWGVTEVSYVIATSPEAHIYEVDYIAFDEWVDRWTEDLLHYLYGDLDNL